MKLAASNIAWPADADDKAGDSLSLHGGSGVELAPMKSWADPLTATQADAEAVRDAWRRRGFDVVAFQALLFGRPDLVLFGDPDARNALADHTIRLCRLAGWVGAKTLVFGSPKNRLRGPRPVAEVWPIAVDFFRRVGDAAAKLGVAVGIEANPAEYGGDFVTHVHEAAALVRDVNSPGFGLHLDAGGMAMTGETVSAVGDVRPVHFHISEPQLAPIGSTPGVPHTENAAGLKAIGYDGWYSVEMRQPSGDWVAGLDSALGAALTAYFPASA